MLSQRKCGKGVYILTACGPKQLAGETSEGGHLTNHFLKKTVNTRVTFGQLERDIVKDVVVATQGAQTPSMVLGGLAQPKDNVCAIMKTVKRALIVAPPSDLPGATVDVGKLMQILPIMTGKDCHVMVLHMEGEEVIPNGHPKPLAATQGRIRYYVERLLKSRESVALFFCSHGRSGPDGEALVLDPQGKFSESHCITDDQIKDVVLRFLLEQEEYQRVNAVIVLDTCHSGGCSVRDDCNPFERRILEAPRAWELDNDPQFNDLYNRLFSPRVYGEPQVCGLPFQSEDWEDDYEQYFQWVEHQGLLRPPSQASSPATPTAPPLPYNPLAFRGFGDEAKAGGVVASPVAAGETAAPSEAVAPVAADETAAPSEAVAPVAAGETAAPDVPGSQVVPAIAGGGEPPLAEARDEPTAVAVVPQARMLLDSFMSLLSVLSFIGGLLRKHSHQLYAWAISFSPRLMQRVDWFAKHDWTWIKSAVDGVLMLSKGYLVMILCSFICAFIMLMRKFSEYQHRVILISLLNSASFLFIQHLAEPLVACENFDLSDKRLIGAGLFAVSVGSLFWAGVSSRQLNKRQKVLKGSSTIPGLMQLFFMSVHMVGLPMLPHEVKLKSGAVVLYRPLNGSDVCQIPFKNNAAFKTTAFSAHFVIQERAYAAGCNYSMFLSVLNNWTGKDAGQVSAVLLQGERLDFADSFQSKYVQRMLEFNLTLDHFAEEVEVATFAGNYFGDKKPEHSLDEETSSSFWGSVERHAGHYYDVVEFCESLLKLY